MISTTEKLVLALEALKALQDAGRTAIRSADLSRNQRECLRHHGFLQEVMKGWYIPTRPDIAAGNTAAWYASYWLFCADYLNQRFGDEWCLSPEQCLLLHAGERTVPRQLTVRAPRGTNSIVALQCDTSLLAIKSKLPAAEFRMVLEGHRVLTLETALIQSTSLFYRQYPIIAQAILASLHDDTKLLRQLLAGNHTTIAGRLAGAFRAMGRTQQADTILAALRGAGQQVTEINPFTEEPPSALSAREISPYVYRVKVLWEQLREPIIQHFPAPPNHRVHPEDNLKQIDQIYTTDAYHSLSIEGYRVDEALIERVRQGHWNPDQVEQDRQQLDTLAARGYWQAFQAVRDSVKHVLQGQPAGKIAAQDHVEWYQKLFAPNVTAGIIQATDLAGYRNQPVYIRGSMHTPPSVASMRDLMPVFFDLLSAETHPAVRVVLGHFIFVYIHPYNDGNGRIGRFLMNLMLVAGGYPWTVIPVAERDPYMNALEQASVHKNIIPFTQFIAKHMGNTTVLQP